MSTINGIPFNGGMDDPTGTGAQHIVQTCAAIAGFLIMADEAGILKDATPVKAIDWPNRHLWSSDGSSYFNWETGEVGQVANIAANMYGRNLCGTDGAPTVQWGSCLANDQGHNLSIDWQNRALLASDGSTVVLQWDDGVAMPNLPTSDPMAAGQLWNNGGVLTVSAG